MEKHAKQVKPSKNTNISAPFVIPPIHETVLFPIIGIGASAGGLEALVQEPFTAKFDSMPRSAIDAGFADLIAPSEELPGKIIDYLHHAIIIAKADLSRELKEQSAQEKILNLLRAKTGNDFSKYKKNTVYRRIERRMGTHKINKIATYVRYLQENPQEVELLFKELLIGVTNFFRDPAAWEQLQTEAIPLLLAACG